MMGKIAGRARGVKSFFQGRAGGEILQRQAAAANGGGGGACVSAWVCEARFVSCSYSYS